MALLAVLACEIGVRLLGGHLSFNVQHIQAIPAMASELARSGRPRTLFLGASPIRLGIDLDEWIRDLSLLGIGPGDAREAVPDASWVNEWYYLFLNQFVRRKALPDVVITGFTSTTQLSDQKLSGPRVGALFGDFSNIRELFSQDLSGIDEKAGFLIGRAFWVYGVRDTLRRRIGDLLIPGYREGVRQIEEWARTERLRKRSLEAARGPAQTYHGLRRFVELFRDNQVRLLMVALPTPAMQPIDPEVQTTIESGGAAFIDGRTVPGMTKDDFLDWIHLNERGARKFTKWLAREAACYLKGPPPGGP